MLSLLLPRTAQRLPRLPVACTRARRRRRRTVLLMAVQHAGAPARRWLTMLAASLSLALRSTVLYYATM